MSNELIWCALIRLTKNEMRLLIPILIKNMIAVAAPAIWRNIVLPLLIASGKTMPAPAKTNKLAIDNMLMLLGKK